jgi:hypothetical protein
MTYLPPPYTPPSVDGFNASLPFSPPEALRSARQASVILFVLAGLALAGGLLFMAASRINPASFSPEQRDQFQQMVTQTGMPLKTILLFFGWIMLIPGLLMLTLGFLVRTGRLGAIITAMVCNGLLLIMATVATLQNLFFPSPSGPIGACPFVGAGAIMILLMLRLFAAARAASAAKSMTAQYYLQYMQFQQMEGSGGSGYGAMPPPGGEEKKE